MSKKAVKIGPRAIELAADALMAYDVRVQQGTEPGYLVAARTILEAAAPHIRASAFEDAAEDLSPGRLTNAYANSVYKWLRKRAESERADQAS